VEDELARAPSGLDGTRGAVAGLWATAETWGLQALQFLLFLVLARQLGPEAYGLVALALTINVLGEALLVEGGWVEVIVQRPDLERDHLDSAFWSLLATGFGLAILALAFTPLLAAVFSEPQLLALIPALSLALPLRSAGIVQEAILSRGFRFRPLAIRSLVATTVAGAVALALAFSGAGVWSLVANQVLQPLVGLALIWRVTKYRPRARISRVHLRSMLPFVGAKSTERLLVAVDSVLPRLGIGLVLGAVTLGHYVLARKLVELATQLLLQPISRVALSTLSSAAAQPERMGRAIGGLVPLGTALTAPALAGLAVVAPELVVLAFGSEWLPAVPAIAVFALLGAVLPTSRLLNVFLLAAGRPNVPLVTTATGFGLLLVLFVAAPPATLAAAAGLIVLRHVLVLPWQLFLTQRATGLRTLPTALRSLPPVAAAAIMAGTLLWARGLPMVAGLGTITTFVGSVVLGVLVFGLGMMVVAPALVRDLAGVAALARRAATS